MIDTQVTYSLEYEGRFLLVKNVSARVCQETDDQFFAPEIVEHIHERLNSAKKPTKTIETAVR